MKNIVFKSILYAAFVLSNPLQASAPLHPLTPKIIDSISKSANAQGAADALCRQGGLLRGSGLTAGNNCKTPIIALFYVTACSDYIGAQDAKCYKNSTAVLSKNQTSPQNALASAAHDLEAAAKTQGTNANALLCKPDRAKLPYSLRTIADRVCRPFQLLLEEQAKQIEGLQVEERYLELLEAPLSRAPKEILARSTRDVRLDLKDIKGKIASFLKRTHVRETLSANDQHELRGLMLQSTTFIDKLETMGIRVNEQRQFIEILINGVWTTMH